MPDIASRISLEHVNTEETEIFVASLISTGRLKASLVQSSDASSPTILRFTSSVPNSGFPAETRIKDDLVVQKSRLKTLMKNAQGTDIKLELGQEYIDSLRKRRRDGGGRDGISAGNTNSEFDIDEDMMGDLQ
jgi:COP9 signalosome complex subunit 3